MPWRESTGMEINCEGVREKRLWSVVEYPYDFVPFYHGMFRKAESFLMALRVWKIWQSCL